jgi:hypothetical protein
VTRCFFAVLLMLLVSAAPALAHSEEPKSHGPDTKALDKRGRTPAATYAVDNHAPWSASEWDGQTFTSDQPDTTSDPTVHAIYLYPSNKPSRFSQFAAMFQADARQANDLIYNLYGRGVRFDNRAGGYLDVTAVRSSSADKKLSGGRQFNLVHNELISKGFNNPNKKYLVWLDSGSRYCGQGQLYQDTRRTQANNNNLRTTAIVYRPYATGDPATGGFCRGRTALHEVGHNLGALQGVAPNAFDGAHCDDSAEDVMCYTSATSNDTGGPAFDYGNDDYWGALSWWTVDLNRFVCTTPC